MITAAVLILSLCSCGKKTAGAGTEFGGLELGASVKELEEKLGKDYELSGTSPQHMTYMDLRLFDFLGQNENTKLTVFLNTENRAYAYAFYMYDAIEGNYEKLKEYLTGLYGEPVAGENESEQWKDGDITYSVNKQSDYVAVGKF